MSQLDLFGATSGCQQVIYKERDNEKEKSPHTPLKGKETEKETATAACCLPSETTPSGARACVREENQQAAAADCAKLNLGVQAPAVSPSTAPARNQQAMAAAYRMQRLGKGLIVSADTATAAHRFVENILACFRVPPAVVNLEWGEVRYLDHEFYPTEFERLQAGNLYLRALGAEFVPDHFNAEGFKVAAFLRQYLKPNRKTIGHRLLISTRLSAASFARRYSQDVLNLVLQNCIPIKLRTLKDRVRKGKV